MIEIKTQQDLDNILKSERTVVLFSMEDCLHCNVIHNCITDIERHFPLVEFAFTTDRSFAHHFNIHEYPTLMLFENGEKIGSLIGSKYFYNIHELLNLWFVKY